MVACTNPSAVMFCPQPQPPTLKEDEIWFEFFFLVKLFVAALNNLHTDNNRLPVSKSTFFFLLILDSQSDAIGESFLMCISENENQRSRDFLDFNFNFFLFFS